MSEVCQTWCCDNGIFCTGRWTLWNHICWRFTLLHLLLHRMICLSITKLLPRQTRGVLPELSCRGHSLPAGALILQGCMHDWTGLRGHAQECGCQRCRHVCVHAAKH